MHYHRMNILVRLIRYRMKKQRNFENAEMLSHISDHNDIGMSGKNFGPLKWYTDRNFFGDEGGGSGYATVHGRPSFLRRGMLGGRRVNIGVKRNPLGGESK